MSKQKLKIITIICMLLTLLITLTACTSKEAKNVIKKINSIGEVTENSAELLNQIQSEYEVLNEENKAEVDNYNQFTNSKNEFNTLMYGLIKKELETTQALEKSYFAQYYDLNNLHSAKTTAEQATGNSNVDIYSNAFFDLKNQNERLSSFIESEIETLYNVQTNDSINSKFPFAVNIDLLSVEWEAEPIKKQNSKHPTWIICSESETTDKPPKVNLFIGSSAGYSTEVCDVDAKAIMVENANGELENAIVNTQVNFTMMSEYSQDEYTVLNQRPAYLLKNKGGEIILALQNYDGKDFYVLYKWSETHFQK